MFWPVSTAVELATARIRASRFSGLRCGTLVGVMMPIRLRVYLYFSLLAVICRLASGGDVGSLG